MNSLAARFRRLLRAHNESSATGDGTSRVVLRHAELEISGGARKTREYLSELKRLGCRMVQPDTEALAALEAVRSLMSDARSGDLSTRGDTLEPADVGRWLHTRAAPSLLPLLGALESGPSSSEPVESNPATGSTA